jgi:hypothetical protein
MMVLRALQRPADVTKPTIWDSGQEHAALWTSSSLRLQEPLCRPHDVQSAVAQTSDNAGQVLRHALQNKYHPHHDVLGQCEYLWIFSSTP